MFFKSFNIQLLIFFSLIIFCSCEKKEILIGFSGQLTGINSDLGIHGRNGVILAVDEINDSGGINGKKIRLIIKDDKGTPEQAKLADKELIEQNVSAIIGHMTSSQTMAALPVIEKSNIILLSPTTSTPLLSGKNDKFFRVQGSSEFSACALGSFASQNFTLTNFLIIKTQDNKDFIEPYQKNFLKCFANYHSNIDEITLPCETEKIIHTLPDTFSKKEYHGVLIITSARRTALILQILSNLQKKPFVFISSWGATEALIRHGGKSVENSFLAKTGFTNKKRDDFKQFYKKYTDKFGKTPSFSAEQGYITVKVLAKALKDKKEKQLENEMIKIINFDTFLGNLTINEFGDPVLPISIIEIKNGKFEKILEIEPKRNF